MAMMLRSAQARGIHDAELEAASGVSARAIKSYRVEGKEPSLSNALALAAALGPWAINLLLATIRYVGRPLDDGDDLNAGLIVASGLRHFSVIANAAADGRIDHTEKADCRAAADGLIAAVLPLSSAGGN